MNHITGRRTIFDADEDVPLINSLFEALLFREDNPHLGDIIVNYKGKSYRLYRTGSEDTIFKGKRVGFQLKISIIESEQEE